MSNNTVNVTRVTFKAFDQVLTESFVDKTDTYIHDSLSESCETYVIVSKEHGKATLNFEPITTFIELKAKHA